ncbi:MAG: hypothetical protein NW226_17885 [Microscillaceae bacterium]|nr:hypothetical protein [Microscillaceae bacterium]
MHETFRPIRLMNIAQIIELAASEKLEKALKEFIDFLNAQKDRDLLPKIQLLTGNLKDLQEEQDDGTITYAEASARKASIRKTLLKHLQTAQEIYEKVVRPVVFLAFANDPLVYLQSLSQEEHLIREALLPLHLQERLEYQSIGQANKDTIYNAFTRDFRDRIVIFHYSGHSNRNELGLSDNGKDLSISFFLQLFDNQPFLKIVFLNGCANKDQVVAFLESGKLNDKILIATSAPIDDEQAKDFAHQFYKSLGSGVDIQKAFSEAQSYLGNRATNYGLEIKRFNSAELDRENIHEKSWALYYSDKKLLNWTLI